MSIALDDVDQKIIAELRNDGRQANTEIARRLGISESTVRSRIQRLISEDIIQIAARVNLSRVGYEISVVIGVLCRAGSTAEVARKLAALPEPRYISFVTGRYDLLLMCVFRSRNELLEFLTERLRQVEGVDRTESLNELRLAKRDYDYWETPLFAQEGPLGRSL